MKRPAGGKITASKDSFQNNKIHYIHVRLELGKKEIKKRKQTNINIGSFFL